MFWQVSDIMHALFGTHKEAALPFFEQLLLDFHSLILVSGKLFNYHQCSNIAIWHLSSRVLSRSFSVQRSTVRCVECTVLLRMFSRRLICNPVKSFYIGGWRFLELHCNRPLPSSRLPPCQNESKCETIHVEMSSAYRFIFMQIKLI